MQLLIVVPCVNIMGNKLQIAIVVLLLVVLAVGIAVLGFTIQLIGNQNNASDEAPSSVNTTFSITNTSKGQVRGRRAFSIYDRVPYYAFRGIPYAQPPVGELRFQVSRDGRSKYLSIFTFHFADLLLATQTYDGMDRNS